MGKIVGAFRLRGCLDLKGKTTKTGVVSCIERSVKDKAIVPGR
jgi:hypothetical protein